MKYKNNLKLYLTLLIFFSLINFVNAELVLLSPNQNVYQTNEDIEKLKLNLDYLSSYNDTWIIINNQKLDLDQNSLTTRYSRLELLDIENDNTNIKIDEIENYFEYSFSIVMTGRGTSEINLTGNNQFGIKYVNDWVNEIWQCYNGSSYQTISKAQKDIRYNFLIKVYRNGLKYSYYDVYINNENKGRCLINDEIKIIDEINIDVKGTSAKITDQTIKSGSRAIELPSGKHTITLHGKNDEEEKEVSSSFNVVIKGCGNLICEGNKNIDNCPSDCREIVCYDYSLIGDTNNDGKVNAIDRLNLINIIENRIPKPKRDCCVNLNRDEKVDLKDLEILDKIINNEIPKEQCYTGCSDGTLDNTCSKNKPFFCDYGTFFIDCETCGCPENSICMEDKTCFKLDKCKCSDIAADPENPLGYDNRIDQFDIDLLKENYGLCKQNLNYDEKFDLNYDNCIDEKDLQCIMHNLNKITLCSGPSVCRDGTLLEKCSNTLPFFCKEHQLIFDCQNCGCPMYMTCKNDGTCEASGNFEIMIQEEGSNESKRYMQGGSIYIPLYKDSTHEIEFTINPLKDLKNVTFKVNLKNDKEFKNLYELNTILSRKINLDKDVKQLIKIDLKEQDNELGTFIGSVDILINNYVFSSIPIEVEVKEKIPVPYYEIKKEKNISEILAYVFIVIAIIFLIIFIVRIRIRERKLLRRLERENNLILK
jgi:uncharacterized membrane protein YciS (DUF1049 family)